jgi:hypothetical protein
MDPRITFTRASTATFTGQDGLIQTAAINAPRFDYNPTTLAPLGLLIEEQRTNLVTYSEQFDNAAWVKSNGSITANTVVSPDGTVDAGTFTGAAGTSIKRVRQTVTTTALGPWTYSVWLKTDSAASALVTLFDSSINQIRTTLTFSTGLLSNTVASGTATGVSASVMQAGNGWYRVSITGTFVSALTSVLAEVWLDGFAPTASTTSFYIWGAQLEAGAFATSYIPTVASQVTRSADVASMTGTNFSSWYNAAEGTLYADSAYVGLTVSRAIVSINDNTFNNLIQIQTNPSTATTSRFFVSANNTTQAAIGAGSVFAAGSFGKHAAAYKPNDFAFTSNGATVVTDTNGILPSVSQLQFGAYATAFSSVHIRQIVYYPRRLANSELQAITS